MTMERDDKEKERDRERDREKGRGKEREKEREKVKSKETDREVEKKRNRGMDSEKERAHDKEKEREREKGKEREREREKERERERLRDQERERRKEKETKKEKEKEKDRLKRDRERDRERPKEREKEWESGRERAKEREDGDKERERARESDKERGKERERDKDWDKDRERERERDKEKERLKSRVKEKDRDREKELDHDGEKTRDGEERNRGKESEKEPELEKAEKEKNQNEFSSKEATGSEPPAHNLEQKIARMREDRLKTTGEQRRADADDDIHSWVSKSRKIEQRKKLDEKQKAAQMAKILAAQDNEDSEDDSGDEFGRSGYGGKDLAGLKIMHGIDKVMEGHAVVLTLKDSSVLDGGDVNEVADELENIEMAQQQAREDAYKNAKKKPGTYEDKFNNDMNGLATRTILPQYDEVVKEQGVVLNAEGGLSEETRARFDQVRQRLEDAKESLNGAAAKLGSDYFTEEDMLQFKKPKKKKKLRKKEKLDIDELEAEAVAAGLGVGNLGSRNSEARRVKQQADEKSEADARRVAYQNALAKAEDASRVLRREDNTETPMEVDDVNSTAFGGEEDDDLQKSIDRARQAALKKNRDAESAGAGTQAAVASRLVALAQQQSVPSSVALGRVDTSEGNLVFTDTGEFCRNLQLDDTIVRRSGAKDVFGEEEEEAAPMDEAPVDELAVAGGWTEVLDVDKKLAGGEKESEGTEPVEEPITESSLGKGLAGALGLLKERGTLKETVDWGGRNMDKKRSKLVGIVDESNNKVGQRDILLDRVDEFGRTMTPKEAFRKLSHKFHGKGPGKMKQEKKMKQYHEGLRLKQMNTGDTPLLSMEKMRDAQARMHTPYIVISGHIKPGQTSDPRSGFATVEKEPVGSLTPMLGDKGVGSLTPMLGDKKVEHFLGIKRKASSEPGSMGPPPPKQPKVER